MAKKLITRAAQWPLLAEFTFNFNDTIVDTNGVEKPFSAALAANIIKLPPGAVVVGGELVVETADAASTAWTLSLGDSGSATRYLGATSLKSAARTALTLTGYRDSGNILATIANTGTPTAGVATVRVMYTVKNRVNEMNGT